MTDRLRSSAFDNGLVRAPNWIELARPAGSDSCSGVLVSQSADRQTDRPTERPTDGRSGRLVDSSVCCTTWATVRRSHVYLGEPHLQQMDSSNGACILLPRVTYMNVKASQFNETVSQPVVSGRPQQLQAFDRVAATEKCASLRSIMDLSFLCSTAAA